MSVDISSLAESGDAAWRTCSGGLPRRPTRQPYDAELAGAEIRSGR
jgi:hypothetical protein